MAEKLINGVTYAVEPMLAKVAIVRFAQLAKVLGPALPELAQALSYAVSSTTPQEGDGKSVGTRATAVEAVEIEERSNAAVMRALEKMLAHIDPEPFSDLVQQLIETAQVKDKDGYRFVDFDGDFSGNLGDALSLLVFVLKEQYGNFFSGLIATGRSKLQVKRH